MEPISTISTSAGIRNTPIKSSSTEAQVKATTNATVRPEFVSPKGTIDAKSGVYVVQIRNASTEMLNFQYPNKKAVAEYARSDKLIPASENKAQELSSATLELSSATASVYSAETHSVASPQHQHSIKVTVTEEDEHKTKEANNKSPKAAKTGGGKKWNMASLMRRSGI